jgi:hypothetical protein
MRKREKAQREKAMEKSGDMGPPPEVVAEMRLNARLLELELELPEHLADRLAAYLGEVDLREEAELAALIG